MLFFVPTFIYSNFLSQFWQLLSVAFQLKYSAASNKIKGCGGTGPVKTTTLTQFCNSREILVSKLGANFANSRHIDKYIRRAARFWPFVNNSIGSGDGSLSNTVNVREDRYSNPSILLTYHCSDATFWEIIAISLK